MVKKTYYNAAEQISPATAKDPFHRPSFPLSIRVRRTAWNLCWLFLYRPSLRPMHAWRAMLLRLFGASLGPNCHFYPAAKIWAPWNLTCADSASVGDGAELYNPAPLFLGSHAIVSQGAYVCGATHDFDDPAFPLLAYSMTVGDYAWLCARSVVSPGVNVADGAILGLASVATRDLEPWVVYAGVPAIRVKERKRTNVR
jgi:putative colanic acid biosynthesis acetyltransferase WcaF